MMDATVIASEIRRIGLTSDPALRDLDIYIQSIPQVEAGRVILALYYSDRGTQEPALIVIPKEGITETLRHELGHRWGDYYLADLSEDFAEAFRVKYAGGTPRLMAKASVLKCLDCGISFHSSGNAAVCPKCGAVYRKVWG